VWYPELYSEILQVIPEDFNLVQVSGQLKSVEAAKLGELMNIREQIMYNYYKKIKFNSGLKQI